MAGATRDASLYRPGSTPNKIVVVVEMGTPKAGSCREFVGTSTWRRIADVVDDLAEDE
jgi:hypothetical protein